MALPTWTAQDAGDTQVNTDLSTTLFTNHRDNIHASRVAMFMWECTTSTDSTDTFSQVGRTIVLESIDPVDYTGLTKTVRMWVRCRVDANTSTIRLVWTGSGGATNGTGVSVTATSNTFHEISVDIPAGEAGEVGTIHVEIRGDTSPASTITVDAISDHMCGIQEY